MDTSIISYFNDAINDDNGILIAQFSAIYSNGIHNINMVINDIDSYQANQDKVVSAFDNFLSNIQSASQDAQDFVNSQNSQADNSSSSASSSSASSSSASSSSTDSASSSATSQADSSLSA